MHCPGHFGHIELAVPVYNPLTFGTVVRLLRSMCLHCGKFKMAADRVAARPNSTTSLPIPPPLKLFCP